LQIRPEYPPAILKRAELLFKLGRFKESDASLQPLLARDSNSAPTLYLLARVKYAETDFAAAEDLYRRACQAYPNFGAAWYGLAETGKRLGDSADSAKYYALAESHKDDNPPAGDELFDQVLKLATGIENRLAEAKQLMQQRNFNEASRLYKEVLKQYPDNPDCLVNLLYMAQYPNQATPEEVEALFARAQRIGPKVPQVYMYYGTALASQGKFSAASAAINKAIELKPDDPEAQSWLADLLEKENRPAKAIDHYRLALAAQPSFRPARIELAKLLLAQSRSSEAIPVLLPGLQVDDSYTTVVMMFLAQAYANVGDKANATEYLKQARLRVLKSGPPQLLAQIEQGLRQLGSPL
jgi:predicted Zn-dependent protease